MDVSAEYNFTELPANAEATADSRPETVRPRARQSDAAWSRVTRWLSLVITLGALGFGYYLARIEAFIPDEGTGYWLGIVGGTALAVQIAYPMRKRWKVMRGLGSAPIWFRVHMMLGIIGPLLILYHSNFSLGAVNSDVALISMLVVAGSGLIGRYIYGRIHNGLYGARSTMQDLLLDATSMLKAIESDIGGGGGVIALRLTQDGERVLRPSRSMFISFFRALRTALVVPFLKARVLAMVRRAVAENAVAQSWSRRDRRTRYRDARAHAARYFDAVARASELNFYERVFALWHMLHLPLFILLLLTGIVHVVAVHLY